MGEAGAENDLVTALLHPRVLACTLTAVHCTLHESAHPVCTNAHTQMHTGGPLNTE